MAPGSAAYQHVLPEGTEELSVAFAAYEHNWLDCEAEDWAGEAEHRDGNGQTQNPWWSELYNTLERVVTVTGTGPP